MTARASALVLLVAIHAAGAQSTREVRLDAGAAQVQQTGRSARDAAGVFGISWREGAPLFATQLSGAVTVRQRQHVRGAGRVRRRLAPRRADRRGRPKAGWRPPAFGSVDLRARRRASADSSANASRSMPAACGRAAALGGTSRDNIASHSTALEVGAWLREGDFEASASVSRVRSDDHALLEAAGIFLTRLGDVRPHWTSRPSSAGSTGRCSSTRRARFRNGTRLTAASQSAFYLVGGLELLAPVFVRRRDGPHARRSGARRSGHADHVRGDSRRARAAAGRRRRRTRCAVASFATVTQKSSGALLRRARHRGRLVAGRGRRHRSRTGRRCSSRGSNDAWVAEIALPPGRHRVAVRINGGPWQAPRGTARMRDEFGGEAGLIVVP